MYHARVQMRGFLGNGNIKIFKNIPSLKYHLMLLKIDREAIDFIKKKGGKLWIRSVCVHGCCGVEGFEPQFSFKKLEGGGNWTEYEYEGVKIYVHEGLSQHRKLVITLQKVFGFKSLMGYLV